MKKTFKTLLALLMALALVAALFVPVWASEDAASEGDDETAAPATEAPATEAPETEAPATEAPETEAPETEAEEEVDPIYAIISYAEENGYVYVADVLTGFWAYFVPTEILMYGPNWIWNTCYDGDVYGARHELGILYFAECADVRWTIINETDGGSLYNNYSASQHHERTVSIYWTGLDLNGKHPAGAWNAPNKVHFTLWIYAVDINGVEHPMFYSFDYYFIDGEGAPNCDPCATTCGTNNGAAPAANCDVPHTGL